MTYAINISNILRLSFVFKTNINYSFILRLDFLVLLHFFS